MNKISFSIPALFLIAALATIGCSPGGDTPGDTAPIGPGGGSGGLARTGQDNTYADGDDGDLKEGCIWPGNRFMLYPEVIEDKLTNLMWARIATHELDWAEAFGAAGGSLAGGFVDWRLPNVNELASLINYASGNVGVWLNAQGFKGIKTSGSPGPGQSNYWSSTTYAIDTACAMTVAMYDGTIGSISKTYDGNYALFVRKAATGPALVPKTGQAVSYAADDDGDLQMGVEWPSPRFTADGDCLVDHLTRLTWIRSSSTSSSEWAGALGEAAADATGGYGGFHDWRLPNVNELRSLVHYGLATGDDQASWLKGQGFEHVLGLEYWTSTTYAYDASGGTACSVALGPGGTTDQEKDDYAYSLFVRGEW